MNQPSPSPAAVQLWLKQLSREQLHEQGWLIINKRFHGIARAARPFLHDQFTDEKEREAAFDGFTLALLTMAHFSDIQQLTELLAGQQLAEGPLSLPPQVDSAEANDNP